ncbi:hypothetical protein F8O02_01080 [Pseudoclavibacter caeni]|uniref:Uncharacterized protein n=1 Tax=Pseudoclavibacter caeni TaxID=908846 RepID=A0A7C8FRY7_9MICO|nr:hypothetical protein F8O02_01080 [Pseudoclavibacter caeni]
MARDRRPYGSETDDGTSVEGGGATAGHEHRHPPDPSAGTRRVKGLQDNTEQTVSDPPPCNVRERAARYATRGQRSSAQPPPPRFRQAPRARPAMT